ncbi:MAG: EAL domain-containing protein [Rhodospirillaceae bacterium]|nr:EAL domain-containing protein [Rhodospirillaceae bacterium]
MSDAAHAVRAPGERGQKPQDLRALVQDMGKWRHAPEGGVNLIVVSVSSALPEAKRTPMLVEQLAEGVGALGEKRGCAFYQVTACDMALLGKLSESALISTVRDLKVEMLRTIERNFPGSFGTIDQSRLVLSYDLAHNYRSAADRVAKFAEVAQRETDTAEGADRKLRALTNADIQKVLMAYQKFGTDKFVKAFVRHQEAVTKNGSGNLDPMMTEYYISMDLIRKPLFVDVEMRGSGRVFHEFTLVLDQIMLQSFNKMPTSDGRCSMNLNVESVFTEAFENFIEDTPENKLQKIVFEFRQANIVENFDEFQVARGLIKSKGATIAVDQIFPQTVGLVDLEYIGATYAKIHWRTGAEEILRERTKAIKYMMECNVTPLLIRVDSERAFEIGAAMGIGIYQGFHVDELIKLTSA